MARRSTGPINEDLYARLGRHFSDPDWWLVYEIGTYNSADNGGDAKYRQADAVAISRWSAQNYEFHGVEVKATRSDWLAELRKPSKADAMIRLCRKWWVLAPVDVVREEELPDGWGLLVPAQTGLREQVRAKPRPDVEEPSRSWWIRCIRQLGTGKTLRQRLNASYAAGERAGKQHNTWDVERERDRALERVKDVERGVAEFERTSGIKFRQYDMGDIGRAVKIVLEHGDLLKNAENFLDSAKHILDRDVKDLEAVVAEAKKNLPRPQTW